MKEIAIDGDIGYSFWDDSGVTATTVKKQLEGLEDGEDIHITINSSGGSVYEGIVIFNLIRDYAESHRVSVRINCMAMSMASYIALAARTVDKNAKVTASENSVLAIHNPWGSTWGDYREFKKKAEYLEKLAVVYGAVHAAVSGKTEKEIRAAMDDETYYVGKEIQDAGFANDFEKTSGQDDEEPGGLFASDRDRIVINAKIASDRTMEKTMEAKRKYAAAYNNDLENAAALFNPIYGQTAPKPPVASSSKTGGKNITVTGGYMKPEELLAQDKALYDAVFALGEKAGLEKERARVSAHLLLGEKAGSLALAAKHIKAGVSTSDETAQAEYFAANMDKRNLAARDADNPGDIHTGGEAGAGGGGADDAKLDAAFNAGFSGKNLGGEAWD